MKQEGKRKMPIWVWVLTAIGVFIIGSLILHFYDMNVANTRTEEAVTETVATPVQAELPSDERTLKTNRQETFYDEILRKACVILWGEATWDESDGEGGLREKANYMKPDEALACTGYCIQDVSGDGIPELLIGDTDNASDADQPRILAVYTYKDDTPQFVFEGWYRNSYYYLDRGMFLNTGSNGAMSHLFGTWLLSSNGTELRCEDCYFTGANENDDSKIVIYHDQTGNLDPERAEQMDISEDEFVKMEEKFMQQRIELSFIPLSEFSYE